MSMNIAIRILAIILLMSSKPVYGEKPIEMKPEDVLAKLIDSYSAQKNLYIKGIITISKWMEGPKPSFQKINWLELKCYSDDLGRIRVFEKCETFDKRGKKQNDMYSEKYHLYDGEKTVEYRFAPTLDRNGKPISDKPGVKEGKGYRAVQIFNGIWPMPWGPIADQNRFFLNPLVIVELKDVLGKKGSVTINQTSKNTYELVYQLDPMSDPNREVLRAEIDPSMGWVVIRWYGMNVNGDITREAHVKYQKVKDGLWYPKNGSTEAGLFRNEFEIVDLKVNDPDFQNDIFEVVLEPDTAVSDLRYKVNYRVGDERATDGQIKALSEEALEKTKTTPRPKRPVLNFSISFYIINGCILAFVLIYFIRKYLMRIYWNTQK